LERYAPPSNASADAIAQVFGSAKPTSRRGRPRKRSAEKLVKIEFELDGEVEDHYYDCNNPAHGARVLEEYRQHLVKSRHPSVDSVA
jgi:hypothetical protein